MNPSIQLTEGEQQFYEALFTQDSNWSRAFPNFDEATRASEIMPIIALIAQRNSEEGKPKLRIIDVGCGRGWLTNILGIFGEAVGLEPVPTVVAHARRTYPHIQFMAGTPEEHAQSSGVNMYDIATCSEVIEHVPYDAQMDFLKALTALVRPGGDIVLTTPRGELYHLWSKTAHKLQPIEAWLTEDQLDHLSTQCGLIKIKRKRFFSVLFSSEPIALSHRQPLRHLFSAIGYIPDNTSRSMIYQIVWLKVN